MVASAVVPRQHENGVDMSDLTKDKLPHGMGEEKEEHEHAMRARVRQLAGSGEDADIAKVCLHGPRSIMLVQVFVSGK